MTTRNSPLRINELSRITRTLFRQHHHGVGLFVLIATLFVLSFLAGLQPPMQFRVFMAGEVADSDVVAHRSLTVEDTEAAKIKRNQVAMLQPTVFDLSVTEIAALRQKIFGMLKLINGQETSPEAQDALRASLAEKLATPVSSDLLAQWMSPEVQEYVLSTGLPWFEDRLREGVVGDVRLALPSKNGIIVRDVDTKAETLRPDVSDIRDVPAVLAAFTQKLRSAEKLTPQGRRAVLVLFSPLIMPTLTLNREATQALGNAVAQTVEPVYYHIQKGEVVVYQGERVTREKQLKLQSLYQKQEGLIHSRTVAGTFVFSLILTLGLFMAPSGKPGTPLRKKDFLFISLLLFVFGGYLLYSAMFAAVGSAVDSIQDAQQLQTPITIPIILALLVMISVVNDPNSQMAFWFSMIPFTSPVVMMARIPYGIPTWEIVLSLVLLYAAFVGMVWLSAKIYRVGIFMYGKKPTLREMFRWIRYKY